MRTINIRAIYIIVAICAFSAVVAEDSVLTIGQMTEYDPLPAEKEGIYPIHIPTYQGVDQLLFLSNQWAIVAVTNTKEVLDKINELSKGEYFQWVKTWTASQNTPKPAWVANRKMKDLYDLHVAEARVQAGEFLLDKTDYYSIISLTDPNFAEEQHPKRTTRFIASLDKEQIPGEYEIHYAHYCYLEMPYPLNNGHHYTIKLKSGKEVKFLYDELHTISRAIKVNQMGYLPDSNQKYAYLGCYLQEFGPMDCSQAKEYSVVSAKTGKIAFTGNLKQRSSNPKLKPKPESTEKPADRLLTGEDTYEIDLNPLKEEGEFFISIPGVGRSWTFNHSRDVYGEVFYTSARGLYHQRCGIAIEKPYSAWPRIKCHNWPVYESESITFIPPIEAPKGYEDFDVIGATMNRNRQTTDATGGWHDAADWDRNLFHFLDIFDLLHAYEIAPQKFTDGQLNIPESGNGIPDILDEVEYGLRVWRKSMNHLGGTAGEAETSTHPSIDDKKFPYAFSQRTRWSSLVYAAAAAQYAHLIRPFNQELANAYTDSAIKAYTFGNNPENSLGKTVIHAAKDRGTAKKYTVDWVENDKDIIPFLIQAKLRLFILTDNPDYLEQVNELLAKAPEPYKWPFSIRDFSPWIYFSLFSGKLVNQIPLKTRIQFEKQYLEQANWLLSLTEEEPYRQSWPLYQDYWMGWGSSTMTNHARVLLIAYLLTQDPKYREAALLNTDYMLGNNPMGMSWTTGLGYVYPIAFQHAVSELDGIKDPVPGITVYGDDGGTFYDLKNKVWQSPKGNVKFLPEKNWNIPLFRSWSCHPHLNTPQCEFTVHETISSTIFASAILMSEGWQPDEKLKKKNPRQDQLLFGYWYLP